MAPISRTVLIFGPPIEGLYVIPLVAAFVLLPEPVAGVLFETKAVPIALLFAFVHAGRGYHLARKHIWLLLAALTAAVLIVLSDASLWSVSYDLNLWGIALGIVCIAFPILISVGAVPRLRKAHFYLDSLPPAKKRTDVWEINLLFNTIANLSGMAALIALLVVSGFFVRLPELWSPQKMLLVAVAAGGFDMAAGIGQIRGLARLRNLNLYAVTYLTPLFAIAYLAAWALLSDDYNLEVISWLLLLGSEGGG